MSLELNERLDREFDDLLKPMLKHGFTFEQATDPNSMYVELEQVMEWKSRYGFTFNIWPNDHLIDGKRHFHFDNKAQGIALKLDFDGNILENKGKKELESKMLKILKKFVKLPHIQKRINQLWEKNNPDV